MMLGEVLTLESAFVTAIVALCGVIGVFWTKLNGTDKRQQAEFDTFKKQQEQELQDCRELRRQFMEFLIKNQKPVERTEPQV